MLKSIAQLSPELQAIIQSLDLLRPIYEATSAYGHFGRSKRLNVFTWERTDRVAELRELVGESVYTGRTGR